MNTPEIVHYGPTCPFCSTSVPAYAPVCSGCGARKGRRSETLGTGSAIMRMAIWANTIGLILFFTVYMFFSPWFDESVINGTSPVCMMDIRIQSSPPLLPNLKSWSSKSFRLADVACDKLENFAAIESRFFAQVREREFKSVRHAVTDVRKEQTRTSQTVNRSPTMAGYIEAAVRSLLAMFLGGIAMKLAHPIWKRVFGRLTDPLWIRK